MYIVYIQLYEDMLKGSTPVFFNCRWYLNLKNKYQKLFFIFCKVTLTSSHNVSGGLHMFIHLFLLFMKWSWWNWAKHQSHLDLYCIDMDGSPCLLRCFFEFRERWKAGKAILGEHGEWFGAAESVLRISKTFLSLTSGWSLS